MIKSPVIRPPDMLYLTSWKSLHWVNMKRLYGRSPLVIGSGDRNVRRKMSTNISKDRFQADATRQYLPPLSAFSSESSASSVHPEGAFSPGMSQ